MNKLKMPAKGNSAAMLAELQAEHAAPNAEVTEATHVTTLQETNARNTPDTPQGQDQAGDAASPPPQAQPAREQRLQFALNHTANDELTVVTIRVSASLNHYMDQYVARLRSVDPKSKYRKQDAVAEAFAAFYADHLLPALPSDDEMLH